jgi:predicted lactoylglutathione lyase
MTKTIFVSLSVTDLQASIAFYTALGFRQELGFMYTRDHADRDGNLWRAFWMDPAAIPHAEGQSR